MELRTYKEVQRGRRFEMVDFSKQSEDSFWGNFPEFGVNELREGDRHEFDLAERTAVFGERVIRFAKCIPSNPVNDRLVSQLVGAGTSVGANYCEADDAESRRDFRHKICICRKEARETKFFLRMIAVAEPLRKSEARELWREANELHLIFCAIWHKFKP